MESFYTIQGEGRFQGKAAYFIRLAGCDVGCHWCDVKESWEVGDYPQILPSELVDKVKEVSGELVVVTGGEPFTYDLSALTSALHRANKKCHIETSGAYPISGDWDWICFSPKKFKEPLEAFYQKAHELKVVVFNRSDLKWAAEHGNKMNDNAFLYLQPEWSKKDKVMPEIIEFVKENPKWRISIQTHKYMDIP